MLEYAQKVVKMANSELSKISSFLYQLNGISQNNENLSEKASSGQNKKNLVERLKKLSSSIGDNSTSLKELAISNGISQIMISQSLKNQLTKWLATSISSMQQGISKMQSEIESEVKMINK